MGPVYAVNEYETAMTVDDYARRLALLYVL